MGGVSGDVVASMCYPPGCRGGGERMLFGKVLAVAVVCNLFVTIPLYLTIIFVDVESRVQLLQNHAPSNAAFRVALVLALTLTAFMIPHFLEMMSVLASVFTVINIV